MRLGTAKTAITPQSPLRLCGYAARKGPFNGVQQDIYVRVHWQEFEEGRLVFIYGDLLWWGEALVGRVRRRLREIWGLNQEEIYLMASHNHSGPPTGSRFTEDLETGNPAYEDWLMEAVVRTVQAAKEHLEEVTVQRFDGLARLNVFRRKWEKGRILMKPDYGTEADSHLTAVSFRRADGSMKGCWVHYPCHANLSAGNQIHGDYPGELLRLLDSRERDCVSLFFQGCTGDLRPNCVAGDRFTAAGWEQVQGFAARLAELTEELFGEEGRCVFPALSVKQAKIRLELENCVSNERLRELAEGPMNQISSQWARSVLKSGNQNWEELEISCVQYGPELVLLFFNGEMSQYYADFARTIFPDTICTAYTNGMIGYLMTEREIREGGYEPRESALYFGLAGTYRPEIEKEIQKGIASLISNR